jgi:hypothetical protein
MPMSRLFWEVIPHVTNRGSEVFNYLNQGINWVSYRDP